MNLADNINLKSNFDAKEWEAMSALSHLNIVMRHPGRAWAGADAWLCTGAALRASVELEKLGDGRLGALLPRPKGGPDARMMATVAAWPTLVPRICRFLRKAGFNTYPVDVSYRTPDEV